MGMVWCHVGRRELLCNTVVIMSTYGILMEQEVPVLAGGTTMLTGTIPGTNQVPYTTSCQIHLFIPMVVQYVSLVLYALCTKE